MRRLLILIIAWQVSAADAAPELEGCWKSNRALTIATFSLPDDMPDDLRDRWCNLFGRMIVTYTDREFVNHWPPHDEWEERSTHFEYRVEVETKDKLFTVVTDPETGAETRHTIHFVSPDRYYVTWDMPKAFTAMYGAREYFDRVKEPSGKAE